jgi:hypothetical protein
MDDALKGAALGVLTLALFHVTLTEHFRHVTERQVRQAFGAKGDVRVDIQADAPFGLLWGGVRKVDIYCTGQDVTTLPFTHIAGRSWVGTVRHLALHLRDFRLNGHAISRLDSEVPNVRFDIGSALWHSRLVVRDAGVGRATVGLSASDLGLFLNSKFSSIVSDGVVHFDPPGLMIDARSGIFGAPTPLRIYGGLSPRAGRYVDVVDPRLDVDGKSMPQPFVLGLARRLNPVLDIEQDLHLGDYLYVETVRVGDQFVDVDGSVTVPGLTAAHRTGKEK